MNWTIIIQATGILIGGIISLYQIRHLMPPSRSRLKADLEILKLIEKNDHGYKIVKEHIDHLIKRTYPNAENKKKIEVDWLFLIFFTVATIGLIYWTLYLVRDGFNPWALLTGVFSFTGIFGIIGSLLPDEQK